MRIYLVRHGKAVSEAEDPSCPLSSEGREQVEKVAQFLKRMNTKVELIECSRKKRAIETAAIIAGNINAADKVVQRDGLQPTDPLAVVLEDLRSAKKNRMLVGHLPYMENMASALLVGSSSRLNLHIRPGTVVCLSGGSDFSWEIKWMVYPALL